MNIIPRRKFMKRGSIVFMILESRLKGKNQRRNLNLYRNVRVQKVHPRDGQQQKNKA